MLLPNMNLTTCYKFDTFSVVKLDNYASTTTFQMDACYRITRYIYRVASIADKGLKKGVCVCVCGGGGGGNSERLKVHNVFPKVTFPPWLHPVKIWLHTLSG